MTEDEGINGGVKKMVKMGEEMEDACGKSPTLFQGTTTFYTPHIIFTRGSGKPRLRKIFTIVPSVLELSFECTA